jgi:FkbM family methyltransferase
MTATAESLSAGVMCLTDPVTYHDVDLIVPVGKQQYIVPASDRSLVPHLLAYRCWEPHLTRYLKRELRPWHTFMDVGANLGYFTVLCAGLAERVIAFEPAARTRRYCASNIAWNRLTNVELRPCALWSESASLPIVSDATGVNAVIDPAGVAATGEVIQAFSLDEMVRTGDLTLPRLDVIKMDIEGAELAALAGMRETIARFRPTIVMEVNRPMLAAFGRTIDDVWSFFAGVSYEIHVFDHWQERDPVPAAGLRELDVLCPRDSLTDIVATVRQP